MEWNTGERQPNSSDVISTSSERSRKEMFRRTNSNTGGEDITKSTKAQSKYYCGVIVRIPHGG